MSSAGVKGQWPIQGNKIVAINKRYKYEDATSNTMVYGPAILIDFVSKSHEVSMHSTNISVAITYYSLLTCTSSLI